SKKSKATIVGMAVGIGFGTMFILALMFVIILRATMKQEVDPEREDNNDRENLSYTALGFVPPSSKICLEGCKSSCLGKCSCLVMFFDNKSGNCYMFDQIGIFIDVKNVVSFESHVKVSRSLHGKKKRSTTVVISIAIATLFVILNLVFIGGSVQKGHTGYLFMSTWLMDRWTDGFSRYDIAVSTAKGLAYLHEHGDVNIVHCDIKRENVLLDANFRAKVSDFGLAKLMTREQSHVFTTMKGT
ncbi:G-type lectin S-receptor-like serine/threonine-protein kinase SD2-5, partial [Tanacetum coccineum]